MPSRVYAGRSVDNLFRSGHRQPASWSGRYKILTVAEYLSETLANSMQVIAEKTLVTITMPAACHPLIAGR